MEIVMFKKCNRNKSKTNFAPELDHKLKNEYFSVLTLKVAPKGVTVTLQIIF